MAHARGLDFSFIPARIARTSISGHGGNNAIGSHLANAIVVLIRNKKVASAIHRHAGGIIQ